MTSNLSISVEQIIERGLTRRFRARRREAIEVRNAVRNAADRDFIVSSPPTNGDEKAFERLGLPGFASFTKALSHDALGLVDPSSFESLLAATRTGTQAAFETVVLGGRDRLLVNPLNAYSYQLIGNDSHGSRMAPAPRFGSRNTAVDMVERYWMALCRDVPFEAYADSELVQVACDDLNSIGFEQEFGFVCTPTTLFRGSYEGCDVGPHVSQFLLQDFLFGNQLIRQQQHYPRPGLDYMTDLDTWRAINNGDSDPTGSDIIEGARYITTLRDAGQWVHIDFPHQSGLWATVALIAQGATLTAASPYVSGGITTSEPFGSLGGPDVTIQSGLAGVYGLKHAWFQKWGVHRRLRPEVYAQRLELFRRGELGGSSETPFEDEKFNEVFGEGADVWKKTQVLERIFEHNKQQNVDQERGDRNGTWLLPMAYPEGSPTHPAYPGGHATFVAAAATIAKALFADGAMPSPQVPDRNGERLVNYEGVPLTIHGELNKLIANVTLFRDGAGMHWRSDGTAIGPDANAGYLAPGLETGGNRLGEQLAVSMLRDIKHTYRESVSPFTFRGLGGEFAEV